jgi:hypothetical protein
VVRHAKVDKVAISSITRTWGQTYRGWSEDVNGVRIWRADAPILPAVDLSNVQDAARKDQFRPPGAGLHKADILIVERALRGENLRAPEFVDGYAGTTFRTAYAKWQKGCGVGPPYDGIPAWRA